MLQQILEDMYVDPELLLELDEEQKQVLFCKMREEQLRRYEESERLFEKEMKKSKRQAGKRIEFLLDENKEPWTWVMGDHKNDQTIEAILQQEAHEMALLQAEKEAEQLRSEVSSSAEEHMQSERIQEEEELLRWEEEQRAIERDRQRIAQELREKAAQAEKMQSKEDKSRVEAEKKRQESQNEAKLRDITDRHEKKRRLSVENLISLKDKRSSEIYSNIQSKRETLTRLAEENSSELEINWHASEKKAKLVEVEQKAIMRKARAEHRASMRTESQVISTLLQLQLAVKTANQNKENKPIPPRRSNIKGRPPKPPDRAAVQKWFREVEQPNHVGTDPSTGEAMPWFHGIISRQESEELLEELPAGAFLVRVSEKVWGYAISYRGPAKCKHFLIDGARKGCVKFFGTNQVEHPSLAELMKYHKVKPISKEGNEILVHPVGQTRHPPDYSDLFDQSGTETSYL